MKDFFGRLARARGSGNSDIVEKDYHLHRVLHGIAQDEHLKGNLVFKGGTCLVKAYTGYYRFSEDIDFSWKHGGDLEGKTKNKMIAICSDEITALVSAFKGISEKLGFRFYGDKADTEEVHISSGGRMVDMYLRYNSEVSGLPTKIKIQVNLVDTILYPFRKLSLRSYVDGVDLEGMRVLYKEPCQEYCRPIQFECYDAREIFVEKCRAAMTRTVYKPRDVLDICIMQDKYDYSIPDYREQIVKKTRFMLKTYRRYQENIELVVFPDEHVFTDAEEKLLLEKPPADFKSKATEIHRQLDELRMDIADGP
ncbi:MAG TPA: nucleotidyl transferase AbiEii/AbiGii toxin family protein [Thermoplasmata archaeon]